VRKPEGGVPEPLLGSVAFELLFRFEFCFCDFEPWFQRRVFGAAAGGDGLGGFVDHSGGELNEDRAVGKGGAV